MALPPDELILSAVSLPAASTWGCVRSCPPRVTYDVGNDYRNAILSKLVRDAAAEAAACAGDEGNSLGGGRGHGE